MKYNKHRLMGMQNRLKNIQRSFNKKQTLNMWLIYMFTSFFRSFISFLHFNATVIYK